MTAGEIFVDFYDHGNLGDDLLFLALARRYPESRFAYIADRSDGAAFGLPNVRRIRRIPYVDGLMRRLGVSIRPNEVFRSWMIRRSLYAIRLGGSLYIEQEGWRENVRRDRALLKNPGGAFFLNGNFGPWRTPEFLEAYTRIFSSALDVTVRDRRSLSELSDVSSIRLVPDLLFAFSSDPEEDSPGVQSGRTVISLIDLDRRNKIGPLRDAYESAMATLVEDLVVTNDQEVTLMSFCMVEGDEAAVKRVLSLVSPRIRGSVKVHRYRGDVEAALAVLRGAETVVATRFHAMVLGIVFGSRVCCVEYSDKATDALSDLGLADLGLKIEDFVHATRSDRHRWVTTRRRADPEVAARQAVEHFAELDRRVGGCVATQYDGRARP